MSHEYFDFSEHIISSFSLFLSTALWEWLFLSGRFLSHFSCGPGVRSAKVSVFFPSLFYCLSHLSSPSCNDTHFVMFPFERFYNVVLMVKRLFMRGEFRERRAATVFFFFLVNWAWGFFFSCIMSRMYVVWFSVGFGQEPRCE